MTGDFKITRDYLTEIGAANEDLNAFQAAFPEGAGYQAVLDRCADEGWDDFGCWLRRRITYSP